VLSELYWLAGCVGKKKAQHAKMLGLFSEKLKAECLKLSWKLFLLIHLDHPSSLLNQRS
jgi:hypothetical protein